MTGNRVNILVVRILPGHNPGQPSRTQVVATFGVSEIVLHHPGILVFAHGRLWEGIPLAGVTNAESRISRVIPGLQGALLLLLNNLFHLCTGLPSKVYRDAQLA